MALVSRDASPLRCVVLCEKDLASEWMLSWSFPGPSGAQVECLLTARCREVDGPCFSRAGKLWCYSAPAPYERPRERNRSAAVVHVLTSEYHPERWLALAELLARRSAAGATPLDLQAAYLDAATDGAAMAGEWRADAFAGAAALTESSRLAAVLRLLGRDLPVVWAALLLRRRVVVYAGLAGDVCAAVRSLPLLVAHRGKNEWDRVRPLVGAAAVAVRAATPVPTATATAAEVLAARNAAAEAAEAASAGASSAAECAAAAGLAERAELMAPGWSVVGTTSAAVEGLAGLWDVFVDLAARRVVVAPSAEALLRAETPAHEAALAAAVAAAAEAKASGADPGQAMGRALAKASKAVAAQAAATAPVSTASLEAAGHTGPMKDLLLALAEVEPGIEVE